MADEKVPGEPEVVKDPTQKTFWRTRNILLLFMTAAVPALTGWAWNRSSEAVSNYWDRQKAQEARIKAIEDDTHQRLKDLEDDKANNKAIWDAITEQRNKVTEQDIELRVIQRLFDREFRRSSLVKPVDPKVEPPQENPPAPVDPPKAIAPMRPDQYRLEKEALNPQQQKKK